MTGKHPIPALGNRVLIDPEARLTILRDSAGDVTGEVVRPIEMLDGNGERWFGPRAPYPFVRAIVTGYYFADESEHDGLLDDPGSVKGILYVSPTAQVIAAPLDAILMDLGDQPFPPESGPPEADETGITRDGLRRAYLPLYTSAIQPLLILELVNLRREILQAFNVPNADEIHWITGGDDRLWAERSEAGWSIYTGYAAPFQEVTYRSGPLDAPPSILGPTDSTAYRFFRLVNNAFVNDAALYLPQNLGLLHVYGDGVVPLRVAAHWSDDFLNEIHP